MAPRNTAAIAGSRRSVPALGLLANGTFEELNGLELVLAGIGAAALFLAPFLDPPGAEGDPSAQRTRLYIDTMGFDPHTLRFAVDVLGADHVLIGSDWPIMWRDPSRERVERVFSQAGLSGEESELVAAGNARRLLGAAVARV